MTLYAWARKREFASLAASEPRYFDVAPDARVLALPGQPQLSLHWHSG